MIVSSMMMELIVLIFTNYLKIENFVRLCAIFLIGACVHFIILFMMNKTLKVGIKNLLKIVQMPFICID